MKTIVKIILGIVIGFAVVIGLLVGCAGCIGCAALDDSDSDDTEQVDDDEYADDESSDDEASDYYGGDNLAPGDEGASSSWGDGTCKAINEQQFYQLVASKKDAETYIGEGPCVVDFWADWCGYCKQIDPYMKALAKKYKGKVQFYKVDADACPQLMQTYGIDGLPTIFFCNGQDIEVTSGAASQEEFDQKIQSML